ncbi:guanine deaminase [soil metagenome]
MIVRGPILAPQYDGRVRYIADGVLDVAEGGRIEWMGDFAQFPGRDRKDVRTAAGVICPPFFDNHIHIPQHPIRGHFMDGIGADPPGGRLIAGLNRNVFPAEARCADAAYTEQCVSDFMRDTLAHGVVGGAAYMTVHASAARSAMEALPTRWMAGLVLMNQNCPEYLRTDEAHFERDALALARDFDWIVTDRFAVACDSSLRRRGVVVAKQAGLRMQTHLNEQLREKQFVEETLYPDRSSYTEVYERDGLLHHRPILAHCVHMRPEEFEILSRMKSSIAHCPTSNTLLGSGIMSLDAVIDHQIDYAICTDVGASPTTSLLNEMAQFIKVHAGRSKRATPSEALFRTTLAAARMMDEDAHFGLLAVDRPGSFIEIAVDPQVLARCATSDDVIARAILELPPSQSPELSSAFDMLATGRCDAGPQLDLLSDDVNETVRRLDNKVRRVTLEGRVAYDAPTANPR